MPVFDASGGVSGAAARHLMQVMQSQRERRRRVAAGEAPVAAAGEGGGGEVSALSGTPLRTSAARSNWELVQRSVGHGLLCRERTCGPGRLCINCNISAGLSLFDAIRQRDVAKVDEVLAAGVDCGATPMVYHPGQTALHLAAEHDFAEAVSRIHARAPHTLEGESMSGVGTPLHAALWAGARGAAACLLGLGASTRKFSRSGMTPIELVVASTKYRSGRDKEAMLRLLEASGCSTADVGRSGRAPRRTAEVYLRRARDALAKGREQHAKYAAEAEAEAEVEAEGKGKGKGEGRRPSWVTPPLPVADLERAVAEADAVLLWIGIGTEGRERWKRRRLAFLVRLKVQAPTGQEAEAAEVQVAEESLDLEETAAAWRDILCLAPDAVFREIVRRI